MARAALKDIQIFNPYVNQNGSFNAYSYYDHGVESQENFRNTFPVTDQCERSAQLMGDDYVRLRFNLAAYVPMEAFSFIRYNGQTFFLMNDYCPNSNGSEMVNNTITSDSYSYDMKFYSVANMLRKPVCYRHVKIARGATAADGYDEWDEPEISVSATLETMYVIIMGSIARYADRLDSSYLFTQMIRTLPENGLALGGLVPGENVRLTQGTELSTFSFSGVKIADVCTSVANQFSEEKKDTEWFIEEDPDSHELIMHFCKCEYKDDMVAVSDFSWKNQSSDKKTRPVITGGLSKVEYSRNTSNIPQVIVPYGSDRNMEYESVKGIDVVSQMQSTFGKRLRLAVNHKIRWWSGAEEMTYEAYMAKIAETPDYGTEVTGAYVVKTADGKAFRLDVNAQGGLANNKVNTGVEQVEFFDDVFPQCHFKVTEVTVRQKKQNDSTIPEYTCKGVAIDSDDEPVQPALGFYPIQIEEGETLSVRFESGYLNGREFEVANKTQKEIDEETGQPTGSYSLKIVIVADGSIDDGTLIPSGNFIPRLNDKFALFNMKMPSVYIDSARQELAQKAYEKLIEYQETVPDVKCTSSPRDFAGKKVGFGVLYRVNSEKIGFVTENGVRTPINFDSRIVSYSYKLTKVDEVQFTLSSALARGVLSEMSSAITDVSYATEGLGQRSLNLSRRAWRDASEVANMLDSITSEMMLVGNEKYQFGFSSEIKPMPATGQFSYLSVGYGTLQHTQDEYINNANGGLWEISGGQQINTDYEGNALDPETPYYVYAVCQDNISAATIKLTAQASDAKTDLLLGILSSEYEGERVFSRTNGFTAIEGGTITTEQIQDAQRQLIIDFQSNPPRIIAVRGAQIMGNITFKSFKDESGNNVLETLGRNLLRDTAFTKKAVQSDPSKGLVGWTFYNPQNSPQTGKTLNGGSFATHEDDNTVDINALRVVMTNKEYDDDGVTKVSNNRIMLTQTGATGWNSPNETYTFSAVVKAASATAIYFGAGYADMATQYGASSVGTSYSKIQISIKVPSGTEMPSNYGAFFLRLADGETNTLTFKEVKLEKGAIGTTWTKAPEDTVEEIQENKLYIEAVEQNLQDQIDGVVDSYFMLGVPTLNNAPAVDWKIYDEHGALDPTETAKEYARHKGDTYTNIQNYTKLGKSAWENGFFYARQEDMNKPVNKHDNIEGENVYIRTADFIHYKEGDTLSFGTMPMKTALGATKYNIFIGYFGDDPNGEYSEPVLLATEYYTEGQALNANYSLCMVAFRRATAGTTFTNDPKTEFAETYGFCLNPTAGHSWRFCPGTDDDPVGTYHWHEIADSDAVKALQDAAAAQDTADGKRRVFTVQPVPPYDAGDLWANATYSGDGVTYDNVLLKCKTSKTKGQSFAIVDWEDSSRAIASADAAQAAADDAMQKAKDIANDGIISGGTEKATLKKEWQEIAGDNMLGNTNGSYKKALDQAAAYGLIVANNSDIKTAFSALTSAMRTIIGYSILRGWTDANLHKDTYLMNEDSSTPSYDHDVANYLAKKRSEFAALWRTYYDAEIALLNTVTDVTDVGDNLCGAANPFTIPAESNNYNYRTLVGTWATSAHEIGTNPNNLEAGKTYTFALDKAELLAGSDTKFSVCLYGLRSDNAYDEIADADGNHIKKELNIANGRQTWTFTTPTVEWYKTGETTPHIGTQPYKAICLLIYAGQIGSTSGKSVRFTNLALYEGKYAAREWKPYFLHLAEYFENAARDADTDIDGGLVATSLIKMRYWDATQNKYVYTAGLSGLKDDNITMWGGGSYLQALQTLAGTAATPIPVMLTKTGAGSRIGCFRVVDNSKIEIRTEQFGLITIDTDPSKGGIIISPKNGNSFTERVLIIPRNVDSYKSPEQKSVGAGQSGSSEYDVGESWVNDDDGSVINVLTDDNSINVRADFSATGYAYQAASGSTKFKAGAYLQRYNNGTWEDYDTLSESESSAIPAGGSVSMYAQTGYYAKNYPNLPAGRYRVQGRFSKTTSGGANYDIYAWSWSINGYYYPAVKPLTVIGANGIVCANTRTRFFQVLNEAGSQQVLMAGLPTTEPSTVGQVWNSGGTLKIKT